MLNVATQAGYDFDCRNVKSWRRGSAALPSVRRE